MSLDTRTEPGVTHNLVEAIRRFPTARSLEHCGVRFTVSPFDFHAKCPQCGASIRARASTGVSELEDVFDAVFEWLLDPRAQEIAGHRQKAIAEDSD